MGEIIFIHIPKTGGTTINTAMRDEYWQSSPDFNYRHILADKSSNSGDIFNENNFEKYQNNTILTMVRNPVDRLVSEYFFIRERREFMDLIKPRPQDFMAYIRNRQTQNYMTGFLKGKRMYDKNFVRESDLDEVLKGIDTLPVHVGIFESFGDSLAYFTDVAGIQWKKQIDVKRVTLRRPGVNELSQEIIDEIKACNSLDMQLYDHCVKRFERMSKGVKGNFNFKGDKYDHVIAYAARACFYEFCLDTKSFIKLNFAYFKDLTFHLLNEKGIRDGRQFTRIWNQTFLDHIDSTFADSGINTALKQLEFKDDDPIEQACLIGSTIDDYLAKHPHERYQGMILKKELIADINDSRKGLISRLFGR